MFWLCNVIWYMLRVNCAPIRIGGGFCRNTRSPGTLFSTGRHFVIN